MHFLLAPAQADRQHSGAADRRRRHLPAARSSARRRGRRLSRVSVGGDAGADRSRCAQSCGLDQSVVARLWLYSAALVRLDLGWSVAFGRPILDVILERLPNTLLADGQRHRARPSGSARRSASSPARGPAACATALLSIGSLALYAVPSFWLGLVLIVVFAVQLRWLPIGGHRDHRVGQDGPCARARHRRASRAAGRARSASSIWRCSCASCAPAWPRPGGRISRSPPAPRGSPRRRIVLRHIARNALLPLVTMLGLQAAAMLGGSVVIESVFAIPGFGRLAQEAVAGARRAAAHRHHPRQRGAGDRRQPRSSTSPMPLLDPRVGASGGRAHERARAASALAAKARSAGAGAACAARADGAARAAVCFRAIRWPSPGRRWCRPSPTAALPLGTDRLGRDVLAGTGPRRPHLARRRHRRGGGRPRRRRARRHARRLCRRPRRRGADARRRRLPDRARLPAGARLRQRRRRLAAASSCWPSRSAPGPGRRGSRAPKCCRSASATMSPRARVIGMHPLEIAFREILPNALPPVLALSLGHRRGRGPDRGRALLPRPRRSQPRHLGLA